MAELKTLSSIDTSPFKRLVLQLGGTPSVFSEGMTYYELLAYLVKFLEEEVIPKTNENIELTDELQKQFNELKTYVDTYFDNLDVQEEINNKLDEMADSGELAEIISIYLNSNAILAFNTLSDLEAATNIVNGSFTKIYGKVTYNDGHGAFYKIRTIKNTDVIDGDNIIALADETLVGEKMPNYEINKINSDINTIKSTIHSVKDYGAVGDGSTDDTEAIVTAINALNDGDKLYFPAGDYIIYSDYTNNNNNPSYPLNSCLLIENKKNITIFGDGEVSRIRPPLQGVAPQKLNYPTTLSIKGCENIEIYGLTIESKGESYGDVDSAIHVATADRPNFGVTNGGHAIFVTNSSDVTIHDIWARYCGSCAVIYFSDIQDCVVRNSFINPASLGYAGIGLDEFMYHSNTLNHYLIVDGCVMHKETRYQPENGTVQICSNTYSSKGGVYTEGAENKTLRCDVINCSISDCYGSSPLFNDGNAVAFAHTNGNIKNNIFNRTYNGVRVYSYNANMRINIINNDMVVKWNGIVEISTINNPLEYNVIGNTIKLDGNATIPDTAYSWLKFKAGIVQRSYINLTWNISSNTIIMPYGFYGGQFAGKINLLANNFEGQHFARFFGGEPVINGNKMKCTDIPVIGISTEGGVSAPTNLTFINNFVQRTTLGNAVSITQSNNLFSVDGISGNTLKNCFIQGVPSPVSRNCEVQHLKCTAVSLSGSFNLVTFDMTGANLAMLSRFLNNNNTLSPIESINSVNGNLIQIYIPGNSLIFTANRNYICF